MIVCLGLATIVQFIGGNINAFAKEFNASNLKIIEDKELIAEKNLEIKDSIKYAKRLQNSIFPDENLLKQIFPKSALINLPKDIVSGDFVWTHKVRDEQLIVVSDCTGHVVPGAMVSMLANTSLNRAVSEYKKSDPAEILDSVDEIIKNTFKNKDGGVVDGMDLSICKWNQITKQLTYSSANRPMLKVSVNGEIEVLKAIKWSLGRSHSEEKFENTSIQMESGDRIYMFTDGWPDLFGGDQNIRLKNSGIINFINSIEYIYCDNHKVQILDFINGWKSSEGRVDDICIFFFEA